MQIVATGDDKPPASPVRADAYETARSNVGEIGFELDKGAAGTVRGATPRGTDPGDVRGTIRGVVKMASDLELPRSWRVSIGPSTVFAGKNRAASRELEVSDGTNTFEFDDLPLAGYSVKVDAPGMNTRHHQILLVRDAREAALEILLTPAGFLDGTVLFESGEAVEGLAVTLEALKDGTRRTAYTDAAGGYLFKLVLDGEYRLFFGPPEAPLLPVDSLSYRSPAVRFPLRTLPTSGRMHICTVDALGRPLPEASVRGFGTNGGTFDLKSDLDGCLSVELLPAGRYRITAASEDLLRGKITVELATGEEREVTIYLR